MAVVKMPYVKAKEGEEIRILIRGEGEAVIYARSVAGKAETSCQVLVGKVEATASPTVSPSATPVAAIQPTVSPDATPSQSPAVIPLQKPALMPSLKSTENPDVPPAVVPTVKPVLLPSASPLETAGPAVTSDPVYEPDQTPKPEPDQTAPAAPSERPAVPSSKTALPSALAPPTISVEENGGDEKSEDQSDDDKLQKGDCFMAGNLGYKITKLKRKKREVTVVLIKSKKLRSIQIPNTVKKKGMKFTVSSIQNNAFRGCKKSKDVTYQIERSEKYCPKSVKWAE